MKRGIVFLLMMAGTLTFSAPAAATGAAEPRSQGAVRAVDEAWGAAEEHGDFTFVAGLLLPEYRSINPAGVATTKATIVDRVRAHGHSANGAAGIAAWNVAHPTRGDVTIVGDTAVLTWVSTRPGAGEPVSSCDVFVYSDGRWRALYSQHSAASA